MTKRERYLTALRCEEPDRTPIVIRGVNPLQKTAGWPPSRHPSFLPLIDVVAEQTEWVYRWHPTEETLLSSAPDAAIYTEIIDSDKDGFRERVKIFETPGGRMKTIDYIGLDGQPGMTKKYLIESQDDVERFLSIPYEFKKPDTTSFFKLQKKMADNGVVAVNIGLDPIGHVTKYLGLETLAVWSLLERENIFRILDEFFRRADLLIKALLADNVGPVFSTLGMEQITPPMMSEIDFREFVSDYDERLWAPIREKGGLLHVHCHGNLKNVINDFIQMGVSCLHPVEAPPMGDLELADAKRILSGNICIEGNFQLDDFYSKNEEYIREKVKEIKHIGASGGGFVLCPTASPIPPVLEKKTLKNYLTFIKTAIE
jgi:hypothetical protein